MKQLLLSILLFTSLIALAQDTPSEEPKGKKVKIEHADELEGGIFNGEKIRKLRGNVVFTQDKMTMYCDSAYQYITKNEIDAFGHVKIKQGDSITITGETLNYNGNTRLCKLRKNVVMDDKNMRLYTDYLDYDMNSKTAFYFNGGKIIDKKNTLTSEKGNYYTPLKRLSFKDSVRLVNDQYTVICDTLIYYTVTKIAYFVGPTHINSKGTKLFARQGMYNTKTGESEFEKQAAINDSTYSLAGDSIHYDQKKKIGYAQGKVALHLKKDNIWIYSEVGTSDDKAGISRMYGGNTFMKSLMRKDTLYLKADTLIALKDTLGKIEKLLAFPNVHIYKHDLQGNCDSLVYSYQDSTIRLSYDPILWSDGSQLTGEFIKVQLKKGQIDKMFIDDNSFMISEDSSQRFNQIKGKNMIAVFDTGKIKRLDVKGSGQSIYNVMEGDSVFTGINKTICTNMVFYFDSSKVSKINFITDPDAKFIPPREISAPEKLLPGFKWRIEERPELQDILHQKILPLLPEVALPGEEEDIMGTEQIDSESTEVAEDKKP